MIQSLEKTQIDSQASQVEITRVFDAPRELVFRAWTTAELLTRWHAPQGCTLQVLSLDFRPGGELLTCISNPSFGDCRCKGIYLEIIEPERIVYRSMLVDANGSPVDSVAVGHDPEWPAETIVTVTFTDEGGKTRLTLRQNVSEALAKRTGAHPSWLQMLDRLAAVV